jgi:hypothetical protein
MEQSPASEADSRSADHEIPPHFTEAEGTLPWSQDPATDLILSQVNPVHNSHPTSLRSSLHCLGRTEVTC